MASICKHKLSATATALLALFSSIVYSSANYAPPRKLALVQQPPLILNYHHGALLTDNLTVNLIWYGNFTPTQRSAIADFIASLTPHARSTGSVPNPSVSTWWSITRRYRGVRCTLTLGNQLLDTRYSLGKSLKHSQLLALSSKVAHRGSINVVLTAPDVTLDGFCMSACGQHGSGLAGRHLKSRFPYGWVGNPASQCPGQCAWPFHKPIYGPQTPPLVAPNGDVGVDGMVISLATILAGAVTNPYNGGYFQGPATAALEAVSVCSGVYGSGSYPGYPGELLVDPVTTASYNANGLHGRKYLLPAMWDPATKTCKTLV